MTRPTSDLAPRKFRISLCFPLRLGPWSEIVRGVYRWSDRNAGWSLSLFTEERVGAALAGKPDGIIAMVRTDEAAARLKEWGGPVVDTACDIDDLPFARVRLDPVAIGRMAARHLMMLACRTFAYVGDLGTPAGRGSGEGFASTLKLAGHASLAAPPDVSQGPYRVTKGTAKRTETWIKGLKTPAGVYCAHDAIAHRIAEACQSIGRRVPEEVAILGTLNDEFLCTASQPAISSIDCPLAAVGFEAARLLDRILSGRATKKALIELPPIGVVSRLSTDSTVRADPGLRTAMQFIRTHHAERIDVDRIVLASGLSRSSLERRFRAALGHGPLAELLRCRVEQARHLLLQTELPVKQIARAAGFRDTRHLCSILRQKTGFSPTELRRLNQPL